MSKLHGLFLDRDGVLNVNTHYPHLVEDLYIPDGVFEACTLLKYYQNKIRPIVVTNQSGVGRGLYTKAECLEFEEHLANEIYIHSGLNIPKENWYHAWDTASPDYKPSPNMILQGMKDHNLKPKNCVLIGDKQTDVDAAMAAELSLGYLIYTNNGEHFLEAVMETLLKL